MDGVRNRIGDLETKIQTQPCTNDTQSQMCTNNTHTLPCTANTHTLPCTANTHTQPCTANTHTQPCTANTHTQPCTANTHTQPCTANTHTLPCTANTHTLPCTANTHTLPCTANTHTLPCTANTHTLPCTANTHTEMCKYKLRVGKCLLQVADFLNPYLSLANSHTTDFITKDQWNTFIPVVIQTQLSHLSDEQLQLLPVPSANDCVTPPSQSRNTCVPSANDCVTPPSQSRNTCVPSANDCVTPPSQSRNTCVPSANDCVTPPSQSRNTCVPSANDCVTPPSQSRNTCVPSANDCVTPPSQSRNTCVPSANDCVTPPSQSRNTCVPSANDCVTPPSQSRNTCVPSANDCVTPPSQSTSDTSLQQDHMSTDTKLKNLKVSDLKQKNFKWKPNSLEEFIKSAHENSLPQLAVLTSIDELKEKFHLDDDKTPFVNDFMSKQKSHEVGIMALLCHQLCKQFDICKVVDLGSGKGYLGTQLAFNYNLKVFGIDAADQNTSGANKRANILKKQWPGLIKKFSALKNTYQNIPPTTKGGKAPTADQNIYGKDPSTGNEGRAPIMQGCVIRGGSSNLEKYVTNVPGKDARGFYCPFTTHVNSDTDIVQLIAGRDKYEVDADTCQYSNNNSKDKLLIAGLHTCGNLCPTTLRFFSQNSAAHLLCNVSCCYHLLTEQFDPKGDPGSNVYGFPLSSILRKRKFYLGQNAKNLACQSVNRIVTSGKLSGESLFQRALLQKIFVDILSEQEQNSLKNSIKLRKLSSKSPSFYDYVKMAFQKLGHSSEKISEEMVQDYLLKYEDERKRLAAFFQVKSALAPCIEALITLDRVYYLLEHESLQDVRLLQLFHPLTSPRCYGIVARKKVDLEDS